MTSSLGERGVQRFDDWVGLIGLHVRKTEGIGGLMDKKCDRSMWKRWENAKLKMRW